jgi:hypothetical protein
VKEYSKKQKKAYNGPRLKKWGTVADLTRTGQDPLHTDMKEGTVTSQGV